MTLSTVRATARLIGPPWDIYGAPLTDLALPVEALAVDLDETRAPYATATLTTPVTWDQVREGIDPRVHGARLHLELEQRFSGSDPASSLTADLGNGAILRTNLVANPSAGVNLTGWTNIAGSGASTMTRETSGGAVGASFVRQTWTTPGTVTADCGPRYGHSGGPTIPITPSGTYTVSCWVRSSVARTVYMRLFTYTDAGGSAGGAASTPSTAIPAGVWTPMSLTTTVYPTSTRGLVQFRPGTPTTMSGTFDVDGLMVEEAATRGDYLDGDQPDTWDAVTAWTGTAHASTSVQRLPAYAADLTAVLAGQTAAALSARYEHPWNTGPRRLTRRRRLNLGLRTRTWDHGAARPELTATSDETLLTDYGLLTTGPVSSGPSVRDAVRLALGMACPGAVLVVPHGHGHQVVDAEARIWQPGQTAWDFVSPITAAFGLRLWCDELGIWHLRSADSVQYSDPDTGAVVSLDLDTRDTVTGATDTIDREDDGWADAVVVTYRWTNAAGVAQVRHDLAGSGRRVLHVTHDDKAWPGAGEATSRLWAAQRRGRPLRVDAVIDPDAHTAQAATFTTPTTAPRTGMTTAVAWRVPEDTMTVTIRDTQEV